MSLKNPGRAEGAMLLATVEEEEEGEEHYG
jgi:hypothetical protein